MRLNQVTVVADDIAESSAFYRLLGLRQIVSSPHYARFECVGNEVEPATFSIHLRDNTAASSATVVYFECDDLDDRVAALRERGIAFDQLPTDQPWLWREARLRDPSGNVICLYYAGMNRRFPSWRIQNPPD
jgi:catechol 2,3-dioxygenase-like lactoylglutathione lyase family enzyme